MSGAVLAEREIVSWATENQAMLLEEYERFMNMTGVELTFDMFCQQAYKQMPFTAGV